MPNVYEVTASDGKTYTVETHEHHDDHDDRRFGSHLLDIIKGTLSSVLATHITSFRYKGRR